MNAAENLTSSQSRDRPPREVTLVVAAVRMPVALLLLFALIYVAFDHHIVRIGTVLVGFVATCFTAWRALRLGLQIRRESREGRGPARVVAAAWVAIGVGTVFTFTVVVAAASWVVVSLDSALPDSGAADRANRVRCFINLKQIMIAIDLYARDVVTNAQNLRALRDYFQSPGLLVCPADPDRSVATDWGALESRNISYLYLLAGSDTAGFHKATNGLALLCPVHHHVVRTDGTLVMGQDHGVALSLATNGPARRRPDFPDIMRSMNAILK